MSANRLLIITLGIASLAFAPVALAQEPPSKDQIVRQLQVKKPLTRSLMAPKPSQKSIEEQRFIEGLARKTRQITVEERKQVAEIVEDKPAIDLEVFFDYDRATLRPEAVSTLTTLGEALSDGRLKGQTFLIAGHTDAAGSDDYNQQLSEARAATVKSYLVETFQLPEDRLLSVGFGEEKLKNPVDPAAGENRRVQVVNVSGK